MRRQIIGRLRYFSPGTRVQVAPLVRAAFGSGIAASAVLLLSLSPALTVQHVAWTGNVRPGKAGCAAIEKASLGEPLFLLPESRLRALLQFHPDEVRVEFVRHWPGSLEIQVLPRRAAFVNESGTAFDAEGRILEARHALRGLTRIQGFALVEDGSRLESADAKLLRQLRDGLKQSAFAITRIERRGDDVVLHTDPPMTKIVFSGADLAAGLRKLEMLDATLLPAAPPARIDLRFRDQIVVTPRQVEARRGRG